MYSMTAPNCLANFILGSLKIMVRNNSIIGVGTPLTLNIKSQVGGLVEWRDKNFRDKG